MAPACREGAVLRCVGAKLMEEQRQRRGALIPKSEVIAGNADALRIALRIGGQKVGDEGGKSPFAAARRTGRAVWANKFVSPGKGCDAVAQRLGERRLSWIFPR